MRDYLTGLIMRFNEGIGGASRSSKGGPIISNLLFVDDLVLFAKARVEQARVIKAA